MYIIRLLVISLYIYVLIPGSNSPFIYLYIYTYMAVTIIFPLDVNQTFMLFKFIDKFGFSTDEKGT